MKGILCLSILMLLVACLSSAQASEDPFFTAFDITDEAAVWARLMQEITILNAGEKETIYPLDAPDGKKLFEDKLGGYVYGRSTAVKRLSADENGWTLIQAYDDHDRLMTGYVKTKLLKTVKPHPLYGLVVDKLAQRLYIFKEGKLFSELLISTGLVNDQQPYNETASGEYLIVSRTGGFWAEGMYCDMAIRFNGGDLFHEVPYIPNADGGKNYRRFEPLLGSKASHGCIRVQRLRNPDGVNMKWLWNNLKINTKVLIWDDEGRSLPFPDGATPLYYNPDGGQNYHAVADCPGVRSRFHPLSPFTYAQLDEGTFAKLTPCFSCAPPMRMADIEARNAAARQTDE